MKDTLLLIMSIGSGMAGMLISWVKLISPFLNKRRDEKMREAKKILDSLNSLNDQMKEVKNELTTVLIMTKNNERANIERDHCLFCYEMGWCPGSMKRAINDSYDFYVKNGYNSICKSRITDIMDLPEFPNNKEEVTT